MFFGSEKALDQMASVHPLGRIGHPEEIADAVIWLFPTSRHITPANP